MRGKGTITISGEKHSLIQNLSKSRNSECIMKLCSKVEVEEEEVVVEEDREFSCHYVSPDVS
jgi:hypothetical protein